MMNSDFKDTKGAAQFLGFAKGTLQNWRWQKCGPAYVRVGKKKVIYQESDLKKFLDKHRIDPEEDSD